MRPRPLCDFVELCKLSAMESALTAQSLRPSPRSIGLQIVRLSVTGEVFSKGISCMTTGRKIFAMLHSCRLNRGICLAAIIFLTLATVVGCQSTQHASRTTIESRSPSELDELKVTLNAGRAIECKLISNEWYIPGDVQQAKVVRNKNSLGLVYQALLRTGPRTVYQSLTRGLAFEGDGVVVGLKNLPNVSDYETYENSLGNMVSLSRTKAPQSELFKAMVEINIDGNAWWRPILATEGNETVQQIWPVMPIGTGPVQVVVRTTPSDESTSTGPDDESTFYWFKLNTATRTTEVLGKFQATRLNIQPAAFIGMEKTGEPVAIGIVKARYESDALDGPPSDLTTRVSLVRFFAKAVQEKTIFSSKGNVTELNAAIAEGSQQIHVSWLFAPKRGSTRLIQAITLERSFYSERSFSNPVVIPTEQAITTEITYEGNDPAFQFLTAENKQIPILGWWGKVDSDLAVMMYLMSPQQKANRTTAKPPAKANATSIPFTPTMAILPPKNFSRILSFSIAPSTTEKNVMILSNRSESAELQKETILHACTF
jgi:hypothetical protein